MNEPLSYLITMLYLFCPNEPPFKQTSYAPRRKTKRGNMCILVKKKNKTEGERRKIKK